MISLGEYVPEKIIPFFIGITSAVLAFGIVNVGCLIAIKKKIDVFKVFLVTLCLAFLLVLPQFIVEYLFFYPKTIESGNIILASLMSLPNPFLLFFYYFLFRKLLGLSGINAFRILEPAMLSQYMILMMFLGTGHFWGFLFGISPLWPAIFNSQMLAMISTNMLAVLALLFVNDLYKRRGKHIEIPYGYPAPNTGKELLGAFLSLCCFYAILVIIRIFMLINHSPDTNEPNLMFALLSFILIGILFYRLFEIIQHRRLSILEWQTAATDDYIRSLVLDHEEFRTLKHDFHNILQVYGEHIAAKNLKGLKQYHKSTVKTTTLVGTSLDILDSLLPRKTIYTLFSLKARQARKYDVNVKIIQSGALVHVAMNDLDLCHIMVNLIDNAIEAAAESTDKKVVIECLTLSKTMVKLIISNSTAAPVDIERIEQGGSTKENHRGHGLATVRNTISLHQGCSMSLMYEDSMFTACVFLVTDA